MAAVLQIELPEDMQQFADNQASAKGFANTEAYVAALVARDYEMEQLRKRLLEGGASQQTGTADAEYFESLRARTLH